MAYISRKEHCGGCSETKPLKTYNQTIVSKNPLPCNIGINKLFTGEVANNDFDGELTLVTANAELITVDKDTFDLVDVPLDNCGGKFKVKGHTHLQLNDDFKKKLETIGALGSLETKITDIYNTNSFKRFFPLYLRRLIEDGFLRPTDLNIPDITNLLTCEKLDSCSNFSNLKSEVANLKGASISNTTTVNNVSNRINLLENRFNTLESKVNLLEAKNNNIETRLSNIENTLNQLRAKIEECCNNKPTITPPTITNITKVIRQEDTNKQALTLQELNNSYRDSLNSPISKVVITGGDITKFTFNNQPLTLNQEISVNDLNKLIYTGNTNATLNYKIINGNNTISNMATLTINYQAIQDTFERCVRTSPASGVSNNTTITRNTEVNTTFGGLTFTNNCGTSYTIPEQVLINENGLRVFIPSFTLNGNQTVTKPYQIVGTYTGSKNTLTGSTNINGTTSTVNVTVNNQNTPPTTQDVTINLDNRVNGEIRLSNLVWSDAQNDTIQAVKFTGDVSNLFTNPERTVNYVANTELQPNFVLYHKAPNQDALATYTSQYFVKAGDQWSV